MQLPSARYTFVAILPTALLLAGGWWAWWSRRYTVPALALWLSLLILLNLGAVVTVATYYGRV
jgi:hypothetical protein